MKGEVKLGGGLFGYDLLFWYSHWSNLGSPQFKMICEDVGVGECLLYSKCI